MECNGACDDGDAIACLHLGSMFETGIGVDQDLDKAKVFFKRACDAGSKRGCDRWEPFRAADEAAAAAPGASDGDVKESLGQSDIMEVVFANKSDLGKCVEQQRAKDPSTSGKLLMKWQILTSGKTANVSLASEEFKGTSIAGCVGALIKGMQFPKHKKQGEPITFPFKF